MTAHAAAPNQDRDAPTDQQVQEEARFSEQWSQQLEELLQPTIASIQQQVVEVAAAQLEPLRLRVQQLAGQQPQNLTPTALALSQPQPESESALGRWGSALEDYASIVLAIGEILDGVASLLQAADKILPIRKASSAPEEDEESPDQAKGGESLLQRLGNRVAEVASSLQQAASQRSGGGVDLQQRLEGVLASAPQWGRILGHAAELIHALGDNSSDLSGGSSATRKWEPFLKHGVPLINELTQAFGGSASSESEQGDDALPKVGQTLERASSVLKAVGNDSSSKRDDKSSESEQEGESSPNKEHSGDSPSPLEALMGKDSPLQTLREFSKRQEGPGGLAPQGPVGRKPPPGPLRRDRIPAKR